VSTRSGIVGAIIAKDFRLFTRDRFFFYVSIAGLIFYAALFWILPDTVDETIRVGFTGPTSGVDLGEISAPDEGIELKAYDDVEALRAAIEEGDEVVIGLALPTDLLNPVITVFIGSGVPEAVSGAVEGMARELAFAAFGVPPPVSGFATEEIEILGEDRAGDQVSLQEKFRPLLAFFILMVESMALATLVAAEIQEKTVKAISVTPATISDFLTAKVIFGTLLAFSQAIILMIAIRSLGFAPVILVTAVLLGSVLVTGFGLLAGSVGKDYISIIFWSMAFLIPMMIPAFAFMFPGTTAGWIQAMPSYGLARIMVDASSYGAGWAEVAPFFGILAAWTLVSIIAGWRALERRVQTL
jgi:ABC-2 type transport system permease protein